MTTYWRPKKNISRLLAIDLLDLQIAQPALTPESNYSLMITRQHKSFMHRWSNWVEICAIFRSDILKNCLETFPLNMYGGGALENLWPRYCNPVIGSMAIIDKIPVHTRPVGSAGSGSPSDKTQSSNIIKKLWDSNYAGSSPSDNICGLTIEGNFLHLGEIEFLTSHQRHGQLWHHNHPLINEFGDMNAAGNFSKLRAKCGKLRLSQRCETNELLSEPIMATAIKSSMVVDELKAI